MRKRKTLFLRVDLGMRFNEALHNESTTKDCVVEMLTSEL